jgi:hypothetical protein
MKYCERYPRTYLSVDAEHLKFSIIVICLHLEFEGWGLRMNTACIISSFPR